jgi:hypothetical protein
VNVTMGGKAGEINERGAGRARCVERGRLLGKVPTLGKRSYRNWMGEIGWGRTHEN